MAFSIRGCFVRNGKNVPVARPRATWRQNCAATSSTKVASAFSPVSNAWRLPPRPIPRDCRWSPKRSISRRRSAPRTCLASCPTRLPDCEKRTLSKTGRLSWQCSRRAYGFYAPASRRRIARSPRAIRGEAGGDLVRCRGPNGSAMSPSKKLSLREFVDELTDLIERESLAPRGREEGRVRVLSARAGPQPRCSVSLSGRAVRKQLSAASPRRLPVRRRRAARELNELGLSLGHRTLRAQEELLHVLRHRDPRGGGSS